MFRFASLTGLSVWLVLTAGAAGADGYSDLRARAEKQFANKSFSKALKLYEKAAGMTLPPGEARWVDFRVADCLWRSLAASDRADSSKETKAREALQKMINEVKRVENQDRIWAEAQQSMGDFHWRRRHNNWWQAWQYYQPALDWWAGAADMKLARGRYLDLAFNAVDPSWKTSSYYYGYHGNWLPIQVIENILEIARSDEERAHANFLLAMTVRNQGGDYRLQTRVAKAFEAALAVGKRSDWYDDALYHYAQHMENRGRLVELPNGGTRWEVDYVRALELYRRIVREFKKGETRYLDDATSRIRQITERSLSVSLSNVFLPGSEVRYHLNWRNLKKFELALYQVDLTEAVKLSKGHGSGSWLAAIDLSRQKRLRSWSKDTKDTGKHLPGSATEHMKGLLKPGAYVLSATAGNKHARDLILISDAAVVIKTVGTKALAFVTDAHTGAPLADAKVAAWYRRYIDGNYVWQKKTLGTGADGLARFEFDSNTSSGDLFVAARLAGRQAFSTGYANRISRSDSWKVYAYTDRPAYRPEDAVQFKFLVRAYDGKTYTTPVDRVLEWRIDDPRGNKVAEGKSRLNTFGAAWDSLQLTKDMPLGEFRVQFWTEKKNRSLGTATLFRLEEYKLPEFQVSVTTPEQAGQKKIFRVGDKVEAHVQVEYYFGGAVADAEVEVFVYQRPFYHWWAPERAYPWFYSDMQASRQRWWGGYGSQIKHERLKTDATGRATVIFDTPQRSNQDFEYRIEARVTDSSRRQVVGSGNVRVTRQSFYAYLTPRHYLHRPQEAVVVDIKTLDANSEAYRAEGEITITRDRWTERWRSPKGEFFEGVNLRKLQRAPGAFPPAEGWSLVKRGYEHEEIMTRKVRTNAKGLAEFRFTAPKEGYYSLRWETKQKRRGPITAGTSVWVASDVSTDLGYHHGGLQIITDSDTFRAGQVAPVMLVSPVSDRWVLFSVEAEDLHAAQVVHLEGSVKLVRVPISEEHVPNVFLQALSVSDLQMAQVSQQVVVPPERHYLDLKVEPDKSEYKPRETAKLIVTAKDHKGRPVQAEVGLSFFDASVLAIQQAYAGDPRQFFYGSKRGNSVQTRSSFQHRSYIKLVLAPDGSLVDERYLQQHLKILAQKKPAEPGKDVGLDMEMEDDMAGAEEMAAPASPSPIMAAAKSAPRRSSRGGKKSKKEAQGTPPPADMAPDPGGSAPGGDVAVTVRSDFRATALWKPDLVTDKRGRAVVEARMPDTLTRWKATARAASTTNQFGIAEGEARTRMPLLVRLQAPRFFVVGDETTISALVNNNSSKAMRVQVGLDAEGLRIQGGRDSKDRSSGPRRMVRVPASGEARVDWVVKTEGAGRVKLKTIARGAKYADAMEKTYTAYEHGIDKMIAKGGKLRGSQATIQLDLPKRRKDSTVMTVQVAPSIAVTMLDALPYLIDYPYGCTEQTMSRFLPAAITARTLRSLGVDPAGVMHKAFGGIEAKHLDKTHAKGKRDLAELDKMIKAGLKRLYDFQHADGGWGWWKKGESDRFMTAYVLWGLSLAADADMAVERSRLDRAAGFLDQHLVEEERNPDRQAWMLHALATHHAQIQQRRISKFQAKAFDNLWQGRESLNAYSRALLTLAAVKYKKTREAKILADNLADGAQRDEAPDKSVIKRGEPSGKQAETMGTARWGLTRGWWRWSEGAVETTAFVLRALVAVDPKHPLVEPAMNWLVKNRRGGQWSNTRDTAIAVLSLNDYLRASKELGEASAYEVIVNGKRIAKKRLSGAELIATPSTFAVDAKLIRDGANKIVIRKTSGKALYFFARADFFSLEEPVKPAGNEIFVRRQYHRWASRPSLLKGTVFEKKLLGDGDQLISGDRVEVVVSVEAKNDYEYLVFEDLKPAGLEAVQLKSGEAAYIREIKASAVDASYAKEGKKPEGWRKRLSSAEFDRRDYTGRSRQVHQELRDRKVAIFVDKLPQGIWEIRYELRAEVPGKFHALPVLGHAMYVPEIRANGAEVRLTVFDR